jgi:hypothetical protein
MRICCLATVGALALLFVVSGTEARAQGSPSTNPTPEAQPAKPSESAQPEGAPVGVLVVEEDVIAPLISEPEHHFHHALAYFRQGKNGQAAQEISVAAALIRLEAGRREATNKEGLQKAADDLDKLAEDVKQGKVKSAKRLQRSFAQADLALARHYQEMAKASLNKADGKKAGGWLAASADYVERGASWVGHKFEAGEAAVVRGARSLGRKLEGGGSAESGEADKKVDQLGSEVDKVGGSQGSAQ